jgi:FdhE protein
MTPATTTSLQNLGREYPDWKPWLPVIEEVLKEATESKWEALVPPQPEARQSVPLMAGATVVLDVSLIRAWIRRLMRTAHQSGTPKMTTLGQAVGSDLDVVSLFKASLCQDSKRLRAIAVNLGVDSEAFRSVADLVPLPLLNACARRYAHVMNGWMEGYCPICGAWPTFAEVRGIERSRHLRCGRCGGDWQTRWLFCPYCGMADHEQLLSLVPETTGTTRAVDACKRCFGYIKSFTTLQGTPANKVLVDDLASVDLDLAALEQGYKRPPGLGYAIDVTVVEEPSLKQRIFAWRT